MKPRAITLSVVLLGCAQTAPRHHDGPQIKNAHATAHPLVAETSGSACPLALPGATLSFAPITGGGAMLFSTPDEAAVRELRERVRAMAAHHNRAAYRLAMIDLPHRAEMVPISGGARLDVVTGVGNDTLELQRSLEMNGSSLLDPHCYE
ncbi:MAG TPA: hypothetical protein VFZ61_25835 [Polyangiales bacterium]